MTPDRYFIRRRSSPMATIVSDSVMRPQIAAAARSSLIPRMIVVTCRNAGAIGIRLKPGTMLKSSTGRWSAIPL